jgi:hypothetical protein
MPSSVGPNTFGEENLVFGYDLGDVRNSYKGEPTTNIVTNPTFLGTPNTQNTSIPDNWYFSGDTSDTGFRFYNSATAPIPLKFPNEGAVITTGPNATTNRRIYYNGTVEPNTTYTLSYWLYSSAVGSITNYFFTYKADGTGTTSPTYSQGFTTGQWVFIQQSFTTPADTGNTRSVNWGPVISLSVNSLFAMQRFQVEAKSHATQFVNGTRSATQGLLDLTGNSTIDLSNVSFDSNAQMTFDGTDDILYTGLFAGRNPATDPFTVEAMVKSDVTSGARMWIDATNNGTNQRFYSALIDSTNQVMGIQGSGWGDATPNDTNWHHQVIVMDGTTAKAYNNGELASQKSYTSYTLLSGGLNIGGRESYRWLGNITMFKIYNRALTASEVQSNYRAVKNRFNI